MRPTRDELNRMREFAERTIAFELTVGSDASPTAVAAAMLAQDVLRLLEISDGAACECGTDPDPGMCRRVECRDSVSDHCACCHAD